MKDRYLYRAKRTDNLEWVEGNLVWSDDADDDYKAIIIPVTGSNMFTKGGSNADLGFEKWYRVYPSTICQCTGIKDKNGKLIFENDIVYGKMYLDHGQWGESVGNKEIIKWRDDLAKFDPCSYMKLDEYEIVGNIFDNPELLE